MVENTEEPKVGMGATVCHWSDRSACTIVKVASSLKTIELRRCRAERVDNHGMSEAQVYEYSEDAHGATFVATLRKDGKYRTQGKDDLVVLGVRAEYFDYSF